jgi:hypothetical protein
MNVVYDLIQQNPAFFAWNFGLVNVLWALFSYFNKQSHDKALAHLGASLKLDSERRLKVFSLKASQYEAYVIHLDSFGRKGVSEIPNRMRPIFDTYLQSYLSATEAGDKKAELEAISLFASQISAITQEGATEVMALKAESNRLKLTATDEMMSTFSELERLTQESMDTVNEFMNKFTEITFTQNWDLSAGYQARLQELGALTKTQAEVLMQQMRAELREI